MSSLEMLGKYEVREELGRGAMGTVYSGFDPTLGRPVALKTINTHMLDSNYREEMLVRFRREAQAAGRLVHPNIVMVFEYGEVESTPYIVMEFVKGRELKTILQERKLPLDETIRIVTQILDGLHFAHENQVVHRDIKPANILVLANGLVKIADFGIAHIDFSEITQTGAVLGTPSYMSPEQINGQKITAQSDLFSVGAVLYEMLSGAKPFSGNSASVMHRVLYEDPEPLTNVSTEYLDGLQQIVSMALAKDPARRFQTAKVFNQALQLAGAAGPPAQPGGAVHQPAAAPPLATVIADRAGQDSTFSGYTGDWDRETLEKIEKMLMPIVGPLARVLIKRSLSPAAGDFQRLGDLIAGNLQNGEGRQRFLADFRSLADSVQSPRMATAHTHRATVKPDGTAPPPGWDPQQLDLAAKLLAQHVGPMARVLVQKSARKTLNNEELLRMLIVHINQDDEARRFTASWQQNMSRFVEQHGE